MKKEAEVCSQWLQTSILSNEAPESANATQLQRLSAFMATGE